MRLRLDRGRGRSGHAFRCRPAAPFVRLPAEVETFSSRNGLQVAVLTVDGRAGRRGPGLVPRRQQGRAARPPRLGPHVRAHDVQGHASTCAPRPTPQLINGVGGYVNAATDEDATHYIDTLPADYLDFAIQLEAERMRNLLFRDDDDRTRARGREGGDPAAGELADREGLPALPRRSRSRSIRTRGPRAATSRTSTRRRPTISRSSTTRTTSRTTRCWSSSARRRSRRSRRPPRSGSARSRRRRAAAARREARGADADRAAARGRRARPGRPHARRLAHPGREGQGLLRAAGRVDHPRRRRVVAAQGAAASRSIQDASAARASTAASTCDRPRGSGHARSRSARILDPTQASTASRPRSSTRSSKLGASGPTPTSCARRRTRSSRASCSRSSTSDGPRRGDRPVVDPDRRPDVVHARRRRDREGHRRRRPARREAVPERRPRDARRRSRRRGQ